MVVMVSVIYFVFICFQYRPIFVFVSLLPVGATIYDNDEWTYVTLPSRFYCLHAKFGVKLWNKMSLWLDKHRPTLLTKLDYHKEQALHLKKLVTVF